VLRNFDDIINAALQARDYDTLVKNTQRIVKHLFDEAIVIPITVDPAIAAASTKVHDVGYFEAHLRIWTPWNAWIEH
jgi:ABC-type transport system substrate-binding protein